MQLSHEILTVRTRHPFIIARGGSSEYRVVWVKVTDADGAEGWGEPDPSKYYGETPETVVTPLARITPLLERADPWCPGTSGEEMARAIRFNGPAKRAVRPPPPVPAGRRLAAPLNRLWGLDPG